MLIQYLKYPKYFSGVNNNPKYLNADKARSEAEKEILTEILRHYIEREERISSSMNIIYGIIWVQCTPGIKSVLKSNEEYLTKSKTFESLWLMRDTKKTTTGIELKLNKYVSLYHTIKNFMNMKHGKAEPNNVFKLHFDNVYDAMELAGGDNILRSEQLTNNGIQTPEN